MSQSGEWKMENGKWNQAVPSLGDHGRSKTLAKNEEEDENEDEEDADGSETRGRIS